MAFSLPSHQYALLTRLAESEGAVLLTDVASATGVGQSLIAAGALDLQERGWVRVDEEPFEEIEVLEGGRAFLDSGEKLPEIRMGAILAAEGPLPLPDLAARAGLDPKEAGKFLRFLFSKGLAKKAGGVLEPTGADGTVTDDIALLDRLRGAGDKPLELSGEESKKLAKALGELRSRGYVKNRSRTRRRAELTDEGRSAIDAGIEEKRERNQLDPDLLVDGAWRDVVFRPYDVTLDTAEAHPAKPHPLRRILEETRRAFLNMGFEEIRGSYVESAFWDFDALFQPQDHPAREMQDTFYLDRPGRFTLPEKELVERVKATHENGGDTGSIGWRYNWSEEKARRVVLRTHTTAATVYALKQNPKPPRKVFLVGRVFRREKIDYKHLPEFHQVDGIIVDDKASLSSLLGTLAEFYRQMGFEQIKFRPDFFPYTEPSVGVFAHMEGKGGWFELGGAGVFRPEVTRPFGVDVPVLAWGLGLERLAMKRYGISDIRKLYWSDVRWLEETPLCL